MIERDQDLARRHVSGDPEAFGALVDRYQDRLLDFFHRAVGNRRRAEALAVEVFVRAFRYLDQFDPSTRFSTWILALAANVADNDRSNRQRKGLRGQWVTAVRERVRRVLKRRERERHTRDRRGTTRRGAVERRKAAALTSSLRS